MRKRIESSLAFLLLCLAGSTMLCGCLSDMVDFWASLRDDAGPRGAADLDADGDTDSDGDADFDTDADADSDSDGDTQEDGGCTDTGSGDTDTDTDADADSDTDADAGAQPDAGADGGSLGTCPSDMVLVQAGAVPGVASSFCVDIYEASRDDATPTSQGSSTAMAHSVAGVMPWSTNPMSPTALATYQAACEAAGKRLCDCAQWYPACAGEETSLYVWGDTFDQHACNNVEECCEDYCVEHSIDPCNTGANCGGSYGCYAVLPTGSFDTCTNTLGTYDICGNVWEICLSAATAGYDIRGGAFNCYSPNARLKCTYKATWTALYAGFRCCKDPE